MSSSSSSPSQLPNKPPRLSKPPPPPRSQSIGASSPTSPSSTHSFSPSTAPSLPRRTTEAPVVPARPLPPRRPSVSSVRSSASSVASSSSSSYATLTPARSGSAGGLQQQQPAVTAGPTEVRDELIENQRGACLYGEPVFSSEALLPTDAPPWSDENGNIQVDRLSFPVPPGWEWVSDWMLAANGADPDGWTYSVHFRFPEWSGQPDASHYVRRRVWVRHRRRVSSGGGPASPPEGRTVIDDPYHFLIRLPTSLHRFALDRKRLEYLKANIGRVMGLNVLLHHVSFF
ncbi:hypothetical protein DFJ73DRAFT_807600, partial [Zopfochytrium polystomum]